MNRLRMAVIGVGHLGKEHARILAGLPDVELVGVVDTNQEQAVRIAERCGCPPFTDYRHLLDRVDAVSVVTPTVSHRTVAAEFLKQGIPVLVEKPITRTVAEADELIALADAKGLPFQVGHIERFNPAFEELISRPIRPKFIESERHGPYTGRSTDIGAVLDLMIHDLDLLLALNACPVVRVLALGASIFGGHEDMVNARLEFANGCVAHVTASRVSQNPKRRLRIWASEGYAGIDFMKKSLTLVQSSDEVRRNGLRIAEMDPATRAGLKDLVFGRYLHMLEVDCSNRGDQLTNELKHFIECVRTGATPRVCGRAGRNALELAERILAALREHAWEGDPSGPKGPHALPRPLGRLFDVPRSEAA